MDSNYSSRGVMAASLVVEADRVDRVSLVLVVELTSLQEWGVKEFSWYNQLKSAISWDTENHIWVEAKWKQGNGKRKRQEICLSMLNVKAEMLRRWLGVPTWGSEEVRPRDVTITTNAPTAHTLYQALLWVLHIYELISSSQQRLSLLSRWGNWNTDRLSTLIKVAPLASYSIKI